MPSVSECFLWLIFLFPFSPKRWPSSHNFWANGSRAEKARRRAEGCGEYFPLPSFGGFGRRRLDLLVSDGRCIARALPPGLAALAQNAVMPNF